MKYFPFFYIVICLITSCSKQTERLFIEHNAEQTGINFENNLTPEKGITILDYLYYYNGGGVAVGDINNDGLSDIYFVGNQTPNRLYLNKGNFQFEDITESAGVSGKSDWNTGVTMVDINGDGLLDIYVCAVVGINGFGGHNELFINNGDHTFSEKSKEYGLDLKNYTTITSFFDYDLDGDLDAYILNHAVHTEESYGTPEIRNRRHPESGDKLLENNNGVFVDVSEKSGIFGGSNGYGLGLAISDVNQDNYPDIFVGNDFHGDDYLYINQKDGTFKEVSKTYFGHTTRFSMGNDIADVNNDCFPDLFSADMLPEDESILKSTASDEKTDMLDLRVKKLGYHYQYTRNMLQINKNGQFFKEVGLMAGIAATDWSWSALFADFNQDTFQDLFVGNGISGRPNDLDYIRFISSSDVKQKLNTTKLIDKQAIQKMPEGKEHDYIFQGTENLSFKNKSGVWIENKKTITNGVAYADLDNDGDLDLVLNRLNDKAVIKENKILSDTHGYLKLKLKYTLNNPFGIGSKAICYINDKTLYRELFTTRGFLSSTEPILHFGTGTAQKIDSVVVIWANGKKQVLEHLKPNQTLEIIYNKNSELFDYSKIHTQNQKIFTLVEDNLGIDYKHNENYLIDFNWKRFLPYKITDRGPGVAVGDVNSDGKDDIVFGNSRYNAPKVYIQKDGYFEKSNLLEVDSLAEIVDIVIEDFNNDNVNDIFLLAGGEEFYDNKNILKDQLLIKTKNTYKTQSLEDYQTNGSVIAVGDPNKDGRKDLFVGGYAIFQKFGESYPSYFLKNKKNNFDAIPITELGNNAMVTDAVWTDVNNDGLDELVVVGEWMSPKIFSFIDDKYKDVTDSYIKNPLYGLWQSVATFDVDKDGDLDILLGNWGLNSRFVASSKYPMKMYLSNFGTHSLESVITTNKLGIDYPILNLDQLSQQLPQIKKEFPTYKSFAGKSVKDIFRPKYLKESIVLKVETLASGYLENNDGLYNFKPFKQQMQTSPITSFLKINYRKGEMVVLAGGNYFGVTPYHGKMDAFSGAIIFDHKNIVDAFDLGLDIKNKSIRNFKLISIKDQIYLICIFNNDKVQAYKITF